MEATECRSRQHSHRLHAASGGRIWERRADRSPSPLAAVGTFSCAITPLRSFCSYKKQNDVLANAHRPAGHIHPVQTTHKMASSSSLVLLAAALFALASWQQAIAYDPSSLQDFCVADTNSPVRVNGFPCKDPMAVTPDDFFNPAMLIGEPRDTNNRFGSNVTIVNVLNFPALNTLGISVERVDYAPLGVNTPHIHPRASEVLTVLEGTLYIGFVTSNPNRLFSKVIKKGDMFVIPQAMIHFQMNLDHKKPAAALSALGSQNPGVTTIATAVFGSKPPILDDVLARAFQVEKELIDWLQSQFWNSN